ncbi:uncharacterized protein LOC144937473 [Lampetra fluviatilis]
MGHRGRRLRAHDAGCTWNSLRLRDEPAAVTARPLVVCASPAGCPSELEEPGSLAAVAARPLTNLPRRPETYGGGATRTCYECGRRGHFTRDCWRRRGVFPRTMGDYNRRFSPFQDQQGGERASGERSLLPLLPLDSRDAPSQRATRGHMALSRTPPRLILMLAALEVRLLCGVALPAVRHGSQECCEAWDPVERSCLLCAAGCYKVGSEARDAVLCSPCPPGSFTSFPNALTHCLPCTPCLHERGLVLARNCSRDADSTCGCDSHSFCAVFSGQHCELCLRNWTCARSPETTQGLYSPRRRRAARTGIALTLGHVLVAGTASTREPPTGPELMALRMSHEELNVGSIGSLHTEAVTRILIGVSVFALCILCITGFFTCKSCVLALRAPGR